MFVGSGMFSTIKSCIILIFGVRVCLSMEDSTDFGPKYAEHTNYNAKLFGSVFKGLITAMHTNTRILAVMFLSVCWH